MNRNPDNYSIKEWNEKEQWKQCKICKENCEIEGKRKKKRIKGNYWLKNDVTNGKDFETKILKANSKLEKKYIRGKIKLIWRENVKTILKVENIFIRN